MTIEYPHWIAHAVFLADIAIRLGLSLRVIHRRLPVGVSLAWLAVILIFPFAGAGLYLLLGEYRLGRRRVRGRRVYAWPVPRDNDLPVAGRVFGFVRRQSRPAPPPAECDGIMEPPLRALCKGEQDCFTL